MEKAKAAVFDSEPLAMPVVAGGAVDAGGLGCVDAIDGALFAGGVAAEPMLPVATLLVMKELQDGKISLMGATRKLGLHDAGHLLELMREHGVRPFQYSNSSALLAAKSAIHGDRTGQPAK